MDPLDVNDLFDAGERKMTNWLASFVAVCGVELP